MGSGVLAAGSSRDDIAFKVFDTLLLLLMVYFNVFACDMNEPGSRGTYRDGIVLVPLNSTVFIIGSWP